MQPVYTKAKAGGTLRMRGAPVTPHLTRPPKAAPPEAALPEAALPEAAPFKTHVL